MTSKLKDQFKGFQWRPNSKTNSKASIVAWSSYSESLYRRKIEGEELFLQNYVAFGGAKKKCIRGRFGVTFPDGILITQLHFLTSNISLSLYFIFKKHKTSKVHNFLTSSRNEMIFNLKWHKNWICKWDKIYLLYIFLIYFKVSHYFLYRIVHFQLTVQSETHIFKPPSKTLFSIVTLNDL